MICSIRLFNLLITIPIHKVLVMWKHFLLDRDPDITSLETTSRKQHIQYAHLMLMSRLRRGGDLVTITEGHQMLGFNGIKKTQDPKVEILWVLTERCHSEEKFTIGAVMIFSLKITQGKIVEKKEGLICRARNKGLKQILQKRKRRHQRSTKEHPQAC